MNIRRQLPNGSSQLFAQSAKSGSYTVKFVDLFAGIGGFHIALKQAFPDSECVFASDIDDACKEIYRINFGQEPRGDIRELTDASVRGIPKHDVLCAGFPCQPFSKSGLQRGMSETRGTLFYEILRILKVARPQWILLENVRNLAGPRHRDTWKTIVRQLRSLGYRVADEPTVFSPHLLPPELDGRPQVRERVFILGQYVGEGRPHAELQGAPLVLNRPVPGWDPVRWRIDDFLEPDDIVPVSVYGLRDSETRWLDVWNDFLHALRDVRLPGFPIWLDAFVDEPVVPEETPPWKEDFLRKNSRFYRENRAAIEAWRHRHLDLVDLPASRRKFEWQAQDSPRDIWDLVIQLRPSGIRVKRGTYLPALVAMTQTSIVGWKRRRITPREAARLQGFPDTFVLHSDDVVAYRQLGNAVNVGVVKYLASRLLEQGVHQAFKDGHMHLDEAV